MQNHFIYTSELETSHITKCKSQLRKYVRSIVVQQHICSYVITELLQRTASVGLISGCDSRLATRTHSIQFFIKPFS